MNYSDLNQREPNLDILIFFDVETTGINPETNRIIEIGAIKTENLKVIDKFHRLVNPNQHIPIEITKITGLNDEKVKNALKIEEVLPSFFEFIKDYPLVAHNGNFDKKFIEKASGKSIKNVLLDTVELACLALPLEKTYNQNALIKKYCHLIPETHHALDDAKSLIHLYRILIRKIKNLDSQLRSEIKYLTLDLFWPWKYFFRDASLSPQEFRISLVSYPIRKKEEVEIGREEDKKELSEEEIANYFRRGGYISQIKEYFEERKEQIEMAKEIAKTLNQEKHLVIEAGTGVGKSLAYLIPTLLWSKINKSSVIVSTHTKILQSQLENDIPDLKRILNWNFTLQTIKGRKNYLCLLRWFKFYRQIREKISHSQEKIFNEGQKKENYKKEKLAAVFILSWFWHTRTGDLRDELSFWLQDKLSLNDLFSEITSDLNHCLGEKCPYYKRYNREKNCDVTKCFVLITRNRAKDADLIIVNHALLAENKIAGRDNLLPKTQQLVVDEAYHMENVVTETLMQESSERQIKELLENIFSPQKTSSFSFLQIIFFQIKKLKNDALQHKLNNQIEEILKIHRETSNSAEKFFYCLEKFIKNFTPQDQESNYYYSRELRLTETVRNYNEWENILPLEADLRENFKKLKSELEEFYREFEKLKNHNIKYFDFLLKEIEATVYNIRELLYFHQEIIDEPRKEFVYWLENIYFRSSENKQGRWLSVLRSAPIDVGRELKEKLYDQIESIIFTSATLTINNSFDFIKSRLGFELLPQEKINYRQLFSPFDYSRQVLFLIVSDLPDYSDSYKENKGQVFLQRVNEVIPEIIKKNKGGVLVLCTSHEQIDYLYPKTHTALEREGRQVLRQQKGMSTKRTVEKFREDVNSIMFGTYSLWEGIDIPGESLNCLIMVKLPFDSPKSSIIEARMEYMESLRYDSRSCYYYPLAIMRLKQGFGRLIRNTTDKGIFIILDKRLKNSKNYSVQFLNSLPPPIKETCKYFPFIECLNEIKKFYQKPTIKQSFAVKTILQLVEEWNGRLPRSSIANVLKGAKGSDVIKKYNSENFSNFGILSKYNYHRLMDYIDILIQKGYLSQKSHTSKVIITNKGKKILTDSI